MSDWFYNLVWYSAHHVFWLSSRPTVMNAAVTRRPGPFILASNHTCPYDIPLLMRHCARNVDFISIIEVFRRPLLGKFYGAMNAFPLDRSKPDAPTIRTILDRLERGRVVGMFPEGQFRKAENSVLNGGNIRKGIGRIARLAKVPIIPCVVLNASAYSHPLSWFPLRRVRYSIAFGEPLESQGNLEYEAADEELETRLVAALRSLHSSLNLAEPVRVHNA